ncbi:lipoprotein-releasing system permease protein [Nicoletella semolina]|uniref:Lipoprotein-releasing system permease protein n=1 Tax=Nicoletella semolina TaxID=271160 RepID=A0A4R2N4H4_9PAST|nr:lipoprotein-releasing ABC transporter permease subunit [Nicoletella semolina]MDH2925081.1 permease [Nicoletella semolina]TCP15402.1 lipoprotein-releasing system permease protein [Nicoletella semolina]
MNLTSLFIALRYWRAKSGDRFGRVVTTLATLGIILGVMALIIVMSVMNGLENMQKSNLLSSLPHAIISPLKGHLQARDKAEAQMDFLPFSLPPFVEHSTEINLAKVVIQSQKGLNAGVLIGVSEPSDDKLLASVQNFTQALPKGEFNLLIGSSLAEQLNVKVGDQLRLMITENSQYTPFGRVPIQRLFTISGIYTSHHAAQSDGHTLFAHLADVGRLLRIKPEQVQGVRLFLKDPFQVAELSNYFPREHWKISDWREQKGEFFQAVRMEKNMMGLLISLIIIVAVSNIVTSLSLMVVDKQGEIAILQTQGLMKKQVMQIFIIQGALVGVISAVLGGGIGVLITYYLADILSFVNLINITLPTDIAFSQVGLVMLMSIGLSLICTLYPAYQAAKVNPAQALRYE